MDTNEPILQEAYHLLSIILTAIGTEFGIWGMRNVLEGHSNSDPAMRELGERQMKAGGNLVILSAYIEKGTLPAPEIMEYLAAR